MRLHRLRLRNYRGIIDREAVFPSTGVAVVEGPNEVGKTCIPESILLAFDMPDSSRAARVRSVMPVGRDEGPEVEVELSTGGYRFTYWKRWLRRPGTTLDVAAPRRQQLTGREAHERVSEMLDETLDADLWRALRIEQGAELSLPLFDVPSLGGALDRAAGGHPATRGQDDLWNRICEEHDRYWTPGGQPKRHRKALAERVAAARDEVGAIEARLSEIEADAAETSRLHSEEARLSETRRRCEQHVLELSERWDEIQGLHSRVARRSAESDRAAANRDRLAGDQQRRQELIAGLNARTRDLVALESKAEQAAPVLAASRRRSEEADTALGEARAAFESADADLRLANDDRDHHRKQIERDQLQERHDRVAEAEKALSAADACLESARVDDDLLQRIERARIAVVRAEARADIAAASVETIALSDVVVRIAGRDLALSVGDSERTVVNDEMELVIADAARIRVRAGAGSRDLTAERSSARAEFRRLCEKGGVADLAEAQAANEERRTAERSIREARKTIEENLRDLTVEILRRKVSGLSDGIAAFAAQRPADPPPPSDFEAAKRTASAKERSAAGLRAELRAHEEAAEQAARRLNRERLDEATVNGRIDSARSAANLAASLLAVARRERSDADVSAALAAATFNADAARESFERAEAELRAADPDSVEAKLDNARAAAERCDENLEANKARQNELRISLDLRGEEGLHTRYDEAVSRLQRSERDLRRDETRAQAARLLRDVFAERRQQARRRYVKPFKDRVEQLGRIVFGSTFEVDLDDDLAIVRRTLNGITLQVDQLSTGALEQLGVIGRLACATIVSQNGGGAPVMIDDALGWSDPDRLQAMGAVIAAADERCQVIVLTCTPGRYSHIGKATVIPLPGRR